MADVVIPDMSAAPRLAVANQQQPPNLLGMGAQALQMREAQNNLTKFDALQAGAQEYVNAINPLTGEIDPQALNRNLAANPRAALAAPDLMQAAQQNLVTQLQARGMTLDQGVKRMQYASNGLGSLLTDPSSISKSSVISTIANGVADGVYSAKEAAALVPTIPDDPAGAQQWVKSHFASAQQGINALMPHVQQRENGQYSWLYNSNPAAGQVGQPLPGTAVKQEMTPAQAAQPVELPTPTGARQAYTLRQVAGLAQGNTPLATSPTTQQQAANEVAGRAQGNQAASIVADATNLAQTRAALQGIRVELPNANGGPLADSLRNVGAAIGELGVSGMDQANAYDLLQKGQAQVVVSRVADGLGVPTDGKMAALSAQTPGTHMTGTAGAVAVGQIEGVLDYQMARAKAAQAAGVVGNPASSSQFNLQWQQRFPNASVFQFSHLPTAYQQKYWNSMPMDERKRFYSQLQDAASQGFVDPTQIHIGK